MSLYISTGDVVVGNGAIDLYCGRNGRVLCCISLLGTMLIRMTLYISTGDGVEGYVAVDLYWGRICRVVYAPNFEKVGRAYWFGLVCLCVRV